MRAWRTLPSSRLRRRRRRWRRERRRGEGGPRWRRWGDGRGDGGGGGTGGYRRGFRLRTRRVGVELKITVTAAEPVLVDVYIVHVVFTADCHRRRCCCELVASTAKLDGDIDDATAPLRHSLERAVRRVSRKSSSGAAKSRRFDFFAVILISILSVMRRIFIASTRVVIEILSALLNARACIIIVNRSFPFAVSNLSRGSRICRRTNLYKSWWRIVTFLFREQLSRR